jgi:O-acetyl-ADP-ribose deacetylase (regulator of RNase III)
VVEGAVLHHEHDEGVDGEIARRGQVRAALAARRLGHQRVGRQQGRDRRGEAAGERRPLQEFAATERLVAEQLVHGTGE